MLPDLGRLLRLLYATAAAAVALRLAFGRWRPVLAALAGAFGLCLAVRRLFGRPRPIPPDDWPRPGSPTLALATGDGVWRVELSSGQAHPASSTGEPTAAVAFEGACLRARAPLAQRETADWRGWTLSWPAPGSVAWSPPERPASLGAVGLPRRGEHLLALTPDGLGGQYVGTGRWPAALAMRAYLAAPTGRAGRLAARLLALRCGRVYHVDATETRRLIASDLPPVFAIALPPDGGALAGPPARVEIRPIGGEPAPSSAAVEAGAP